jgi:hypothetical protein
MEVEPSVGGVAADVVDETPMVKDVEVCGVCGDAEAKYKCPRCAKRTCSLKCVKTHKQADDCRFLPTFRLTYCISIVSTRQDPAHMQLGEMSHSSWFHLTTAGQPLPRSGTPHCGG